MSQAIALEKIVRALKMSTDELDLSSLNLTSIPSELLELIHLRKLNLNGNLITTLPPEISKLNHLETFFLSKNRLVSLPPEIYKLKSLQVLELDENFLTSVSPGIIKLSNLTHLDLQKNRLTCLPPEIWKLSKLTFLDVRDNELTDIPPHPQDIKNLKTLDLRNNNLPVLPEILSKYYDPPAILSYLAQVRDGKRHPLAETKMLVVGQARVGKTSLIQRLTNNSYNKNSDPTKGIEINHWQVSNTLKDGNQPQYIRVNIWDFGGQQIMHATHQFFLTKRSLYLLVLDACITQEENRVEYWLKIIQSFGGESPILIVGNKIDQFKLDIDRNGLSKKYPNIVGFLETSVVTGAGLNDLKSAIEKAINQLPHVRDILPVAWFELKNRLEKLSRERNYITYENFIETCDKGKIQDDISQRTLIDLLHDLGVLLYFRDDQRLESLGILNPQWVADGVYTILNTHKIFHNKGVLDRSTLDEILPTQEYPANKRLFIVDMMRKFELCYDIIPDQKFLIPDLLPKDEPYIEEWKDPLTFEYHYNVLPASIITRFIVRTHSYIHQSIWRTGVMLKTDSNIALVKADLEDKKIYISITGEQSTRRGFLSIIQAEFKIIHESIAKIEVIAKVPVPEYPQTEPIALEMLLQAMREQRTTIPVFSNGKIKDINVQELFNRIATEHFQSNNLNDDIHSDGNISSKNVENHSAAKIKTKNSVRSLFLKILTKAFDLFPRSIGNTILILLGRDSTKDSVVSLIVGYSMIALIILLISGVVTLEMLRETWRFFFPIK